MNQLGSFEDTIEKGQSGVKQAVKSAQTGATNFAKTAAGQTSNSSLSDSGINETNAQNPAQQQMSDDDAQKFLQDLYGVKTPAQNLNQQNPSQPAQANSLPAAKKPTQNQQTVKAALGLELSKKPQEKVPTTKDTLKAALGIPGEKPALDAPSVRETVTTAMGLPDILSSGVKTPEEEAKMEALRGQLHGEYYRKLTKPQQQAEETVVDKLEREDQEKKMEDIETQKEKPPPLPATVKQGTGENIVGVSG